MNGKEMREKLASGGKVFGTAIQSLGLPGQIVAFSQTGVDFVFIDNEHTPLDRSKTAFACHLFAGRGVAPLVRIPEPDLHMAAMVLDAGAQGLIVPCVENQDQVWSAICAARYRPLKGRALDRLYSDDRFPSEDTERYLERNNENEFAEKRCGKSCSGGSGMFEVMAECCKGMSGPGDSRSMMAGCMKMCRWFPLIPVIIGVLFLLLGYFLNAEVTRILWMTAAGLVILMGAFGFLMMSLSKRTCC